MRIMGLDFGSKTVGVAVSDELLLTAQSVETIRRKSKNKLRQTYARIEDLAKEYEVDRFVLGYPKNMNNTVGDGTTTAIALTFNLFNRYQEYRTGGSIRKPPTERNYQPVSDLFLS